jgi:hypothetical protein
MLDLPQNTMERYLKNVDKNPVYLAQPKIGRLPFIPPAMETNFIKYSLITEKRSSAWHRKIFLARLTNCL